MPIRDGTRVRANRFHDFHQCWTAALCNALNAGALPPRFFALIEEKREGWNTQKRFADLSTSALPLRGMPTAHEETPL
jgi:hypothetical protein